MRFILQKLVLVIALLAPTLSHGLASCPVSLSSSLIVAGQTTTLTAGCTGNLAGFPISGYRWAVYAGSTLVFAATTTTNTTFMTSSVGGNQAGMVQLTVFYTFAGDIGAGSSQVMFLNAPPACTLAGVPTAPISPGSTVTLKGSCNFQDVPGFSARWSDETGGALGTGPDLTVTPGNNKKLTFWGSNDAFPLSATAQGNVTVTGSIDPSLGIPATLPPVARNVTAGGTMDRLDLNVTMQFDPSIAGRNGNLFVGAFVPSSANVRAALGIRSAAETRQGKDSTGSWVIQHEGQWSLYLGGAIPANFSGVLNDASALVTILQGADTTGLCGADIYVGYGASDFDMLANNTLGKIYTVVCNYDFIGTSTGNSANLSLSASVKPATVDRGRSGKFYVGRLQNGQWHLFNGTGWQPYGGGGIPEFAAESLADRQIPIFSNANVQDIAGSQIFVGYGLDDGDLLANHKYGLIHTIQ